MNEQLISDSLKGCDTDIYQCEHIPFYTDFAWNIFQIVYSFKLLKPLRWSIVKVTSWLVLISFFNFSTKSTVHQK